MRSRNAGPPTLLAKVESRYKRRAEKLHQAWVLTQEALTL